MKRRALRRRYGRSQSQRARTAMRDISSRKQALWEAYHRGEITSKQLNDRTIALERRRQKLQKFTARVEYRPGQVVVSKWGEKRTITGYTRPDWSSNDVIYRTIDERGVNDMWPAEVIVRAVGGAK